MGTTPSHLLPNLVTASLPLLPGLELQGAPTLRLALLRLLLGEEGPGRSQWGGPSTGKCFLILQGKYSQAGAFLSDIQLFLWRHCNGHNRNSQRAEEGQEPKDKQPVQRAGLTGACLLWETSLLTLVGDLLSMSDSHLE